MDEEGNHNDSPSPWEDVQKQPVRVALIVLGLAVLVSGVLGNAFLLALMWMQRGQRPSAGGVRQSIIINLAVADVVVVCLGLPVLLVDLISVEVPPSLLFSPLQCRVYRYFLRVGQTVSVCSIVLISLHRYLKVCHRPALRRSLFARPRNARLLLAPWALALLFEAPVLLPLVVPSLEVRAPLSNDTHGCGTSRDPAVAGRRPVDYGSVATVLVLTLPVLLIGYFNAAIFRRWYGSHRRLQKGRTTLMMTHRAKSFAASASASAVDLSTEMTDKEGGGREEEEEEEEEAESAEKRAGPVDARTESSYSVAPSIEIAADDVDDDDDDDDAVKDTKKRPSERGDRGAVTYDTNVNRIVKDPGAEAQHTHVKRTVRDIVTKADDTILKTIDREPGAGAERSGSVKNLIRDLDAKAEENRDKDRGASAETSGSVKNLVRDLDAKARHQPSPKGSRFKKNAPTAFLKTTSLARLGLRPLSAQIAKREEENEEEEAIATLTKSCKASRKARAATLRLRTIGIMPSALAEAARRFTHGTLKGSSSSSLSRSSRRSARDVVHGDGFHRPPSVSLSWLYWSDAQSDTVDVACRNDAKTEAAVVGGRHSRAEFQMSAVAEAETCSSDLASDTESRTEESGEMTGAGAVTDGKTGRAGRHRPTRGIMYPDLDPAGASLRRKACSNNANNNSHSNSNSISNNNAISYSPPVPGGSALRRRCTTTLERNKQKSSSDLAVVRYLLVIFLCLLLFFTPRVVIILLSHFRPRVPPEADVASTLLVFLNSGVNWIVYGLMNTLLRHAFTDTWTLCCCVPSVQR